MNFRQFVSIACALVALGGCVPARVARTAGASGTVLDATTQEPVVAAVIRCSQSPELVVQTDRAGYFNLPPKVAWHLVPLGGDWITTNCSLKVEASGYVSQSIDVSFGDDRPRAVRLVRAN